MNEGIEGFGSRGRCRREVGMKVRIVGVGEVSWGFFEEVVL